MRQSLIIVAPDVFFPDLLFYTSRLIKYLVITVCHCCHGDNIYSHMTAPQGDQEVVFMAGGGLRGSYVRAAACLLIYVEPLMTSYSTVERAIN